jgi:hypothetical protein
MTYGAVEQFLVTSLRRYAYETVQGPRNAIGR